MLNSVFTEMRTYSKNFVRASWAGTTLYCIVNCKDGTMNWGRLDISKFHGISWITIQTVPYLISCMNFVKALQSAMQPLSIWASKPKFVLHRSKTREAPPSKISLPRLGLFFALMLARLMAKVVSAFESGISIHRIKCWTHVITALFWIQGRKKEWNIFVEKSQRNSWFNSRRMLVRHTGKWRPGRYSFAKSKGITATELRHLVKWSFEVGLRWK